MTEPTSISDAAVDAYIAASADWLTEYRSEVRAGLAAALPHLRRVSAAPVRECIHCDSPARAGSPTCGECPDSVDPAPPDTTHTDGVTPGTSAWGAC